MKLAVSGYSQKLEDEYRQASYTSWLVDAFRRSKKLPPLKKILATVAEQQKGPKGWRDLKELAKAHVAMALPDDV